MIVAKIAFPLNYLFSSTAMEAYSSIFVLLLQIRRARNAVEGIPMIHMRALHGYIPWEEMKAFYSLRGKLAWLTTYVSVLAELLQRWKHDRAEPRRTMTNFIMTYVIHAQVLKLHEALREAPSLDHMIAVHAHQ